jgi:hypothetical protein
MAFTLPPTRRLRFRARVFEVKAPKIFARLGMP